MAGLTDVNNKITLELKTRHVPFAVAAQRAPAARQQTPVQSWCHHHTPTPAAVTPAPASLLLDAAPTMMKNEV